MKGRVLAGKAAVVAVSILPLAAEAHHSYAQFDRCAPVTIEGEIKRIDWANPHIVITVDTADAVRYRIEWLDMFRLRRAGMSSESLNSGDRVVITGARNRDPEANVITLISEMHRPRDGWRYSRALERPDACDE